MNTWPRCTRHMPFDALHDTFANMLSHVACFSSSWLEGRQYLYMCLKYSYSQNMLYINIVIVDFYLPMCALNWHMHICIYVIYYIIYIYICIAIICHSSNMSFCAKPMHSWNMPSAKRCSKASFSSARQGLAGRCKSSERETINRMTHASASPRWKERWDMAWGLKHWSGWNTVRVKAEDNRPRHMFLISVILPVEITWIQALSWCILPCLPLSGHYIVIHATSDTSIEVFVIHCEIGALNMSTSCQLVRADKFAEVDRSRKWTSASWTKKHHPLKTILFSPWNNWFPLQTNALSP